MNDVLLSAALTLTGIILTAIVSNRIIVYRVDKLESSFSDFKNKYEKKQDESDKLIESHTLEIIRIEDSIGLEPQVLRFGGEYKRA
jgi:hypothetical protein